MQRRILALLLSLAVFALCLAGCGGDSAAPTDPPATDAPEAPGTADEDVPEGQSAYTLIYRDQNGDPVPGLTANICDDDACTPMVTDENGTIHFVQASFAYHIQVLKVPEGYDFDRSQEFYTEATGGTYEFTVTKN